MGKTVTVTRPMVLAYCLVNRQDLARNWPAGTNESADKIRAAFELVEQYMRVHGPDSISVPEEGER